MAEQSLAERRLPNTREIRALALAEERFEEIAASHRRGAWTVPSASSDRTYTVRYARDEESCECPDHQYRGVNCVHILAAAVVKAKSAPCDGCGRRVRRSELAEVVESLTYHEGDVLCPSCAASSDAETL